MAAITESDRMNFRTQLVDGKPRIFFDAIDESSNKTKSKRNSRAVNRLSEQKSKINNQKYETKRTEQPTNQKRVNGDGTGLGVYMTMDELAELVNAVKENTKSDIDASTETKAPQRYETMNAPVVPKLDLVLEPPPLPPSQVSPRDEALGKMAEKKRQKWIREKAEIERMQLEIEYDQLKHKLSPRHTKNPTSPQRSTFQYDFPPPTNKPPLASPPSKLPLPHPQSFKQNILQYDNSTRNNEESNQDPYKTRLMEKKQQQWQQENTDKMPFWDPFGRPGAGAPKNNENPPRTSQPPSNTNVAYRPSVPQHQSSDYPSSSLPPNSSTQNDQARVPAAMRTNLAFGNGRHEEDVKATQELERRQWLGDLHKQIEENKRKKNALQETERRQDFLRDNVHPLVQEAANRHQQPTTNHTEQDFNKFSQYNSSGQRTDVVPKSLPGPVSNQRTGENIFGPTYDASSTQNTNNKVDSSHLNVGINRQYPYRPMDAGRDEAVNTVDATFRSDHGNQSDGRMPPNRRIPPYAYEDSDLPPQGPNHHYRNTANQPGKKTIRIRSLDDNQPLPRHTSTTNNQSHSNNVGTTSQMNSHRTNHGPVDSQNRPLWNYNKNKRGEYVSNSKRDPHYEKRQRLKQLELGNFDRVDDVQRKTCYNRWNSDSEIQQQQKKQAPMNRTRSTIPKATGSGNHKDESIMNLLKGQNKQPEIYGVRYPPSTHIKADNEYNSNRISSLDRYENDVPYTKPDEQFDLAKVYSQSTDTSPHKQITNTNTNNNYQPQEWDNTNRQYPVVQPTQYNVPATKQEHILQQLSTIKENLIRRQREVASQ